MTVLIIVSSCCAGLSGACKFIKQYNTVGNVFYNYLTVFMSLCVYCNVLSRFIFHSFVYLILFSDCLPTDSGDCLPTDSGGRGGSSWLPPIKMSGPSVVPQMQRQMVALCNVCAHH